MKFGVVIHEVLNELKWSINEEEKSVLKQREMRREVGYKSG